MQFIDRSASDFDYLARIKCVGEERPRFYGAVGSALSRYIKPFFFIKHNRIILVLLFYNILWLEPKKDLDFYDKVTNAFIKKDKWFYL